MMEWYLTEVNMEPLVEPVPMVPPAGSIYGKDGTTALSLTSQGIWFYEAIIDLPDSDCALVLVD